MVIFDPFKGVVVLAKVFDTYKYSKGFDDFINGFGSNIPKDFIVIGACMDECVSNLSQEAKTWFGKLGSLEIHDLEYRCAYTIIGIGGRK